MYVSCTIENSTENTKREVPIETKGCIESCTLEAGYLSVYKVEKDWDHENREYKKTRILVVGRKYKILVRDAEKSKWNAWKEGYTDNNGGVDHMKGCKEWKWYRIEITNEGDEDYVRMILNRDTLVNLRGLEMYDRMQLEKKRS